jgi:hypothetical protein
MALNKAYHWTTAVRPVMRLFCDVYLYYLRLRTELSLELAQGLDIDNPALRDWAKRGRG